MGHVFVVAALGPIGYAKGRDKFGIVKDPVRVDSDRTNAKHIRDQVVAKVSAAGDVATAMRALQPGFAGLLGMDEMKYLAEIVKGSIQLVKPADQNFPAITYGSGPLAIVIGHTPTTDGAGDVCQNHFSLLQSWLNGSDDYGQAISASASEPQPTRSRLTIADRSSTPGVSSQAAVPQPSSPISAWEPLEFKDLHDNMGSLLFEPEGENVPESFVAHLNQVFQEHRHIGT